AYKVASLRACKAEVMKMCAADDDNPILIRLAWHDAGTFNKDSAESWPRCGGANGSIRFEPEINHEANLGLVFGLKLLQPLKDKYPEVGWADLIQLASATAVEEAGGPVIDMRYGRKDAATPKDCVDEGNLPAGDAPFPDADTPQNARHGFFRSLSWMLLLPVDTMETLCSSCSWQAHLRNVFYRMGFGDEGIVALSGAHTLGRAGQLNAEGDWSPCTKFTAAGVCPRGRRTKQGKPRGSSWTRNWMKFDNSYFATVPDEEGGSELFKLETDKCLFVDKGFLPFAQKYKESQEAFFEDYKKAHKMLSELGAVWEPEGGFTI
ncbi:unnamed protein product, partial [Ectocarpus sp. 6 AP-2014]